MSLFKTTILPTDSKKDAINMLSELIFDEPLVLLIVLGKNDAASRLVQRADKLTGALDEPRWVVWARRPEQIEEVVALLQNNNQLVANYPAALAFSLSFSDTVRDLIMQTDPEPDMVRILESFIKAESEVI